MSQTALNDDALLGQLVAEDRRTTGISRDAADAPADLPSQFDYRPVPPYAPVAAGIGLISGAAMFSEFFMLVAFFGMIVGGFAVWRIRKANGTLGGRLWARIGLFASVIFFFGGLTSHIYAYMTEVPEGHIRVNFSHEVSDKQFIIKNGVRELHPAVAPLKDQKIFIKGFMYATRKNTGLEDFVLLKDNGQCCFGGSPKPYDMMVVKLLHGKTVNKIDGMVAVAGTLRCNPHSPGAVYMIEATYVDRARTSH